MTIQPAARLATSVPPHRRSSVRSRAWRAMTVTTGIRKSSVNSSLLANVRVMNPIEKARPPMSVEPVASSTTKSARTPIATSTPPTAPVASRDTSRLDRRRRPWSTLWRKRCSTSTSATAGSVAGSDPTPGRGAFTGSTFPLRPRAIRERARREGRDRRGDGAPELVLERAERPQDERLGPGRSHDGDADGEPLDAPDGERRRRVPRDRSRRPAVPGVAVPEDVVDRPGRSHRGQDDDVDALGEEPVQTVLARRPLDPVERLQVGGRAEPVGGGGPAHEVEGEQVRPLARLGFGVREEVCEACRTPSRAL